MFPVTVPLNHASDKPANINESKTREAAVGLNKFLPSPPKKHLKITVAINAAKTGNQYGTVTGNTSAVMNPVIILEKSYQKIFFLVISLNKISKT